MLGCVALFALGGALAGASRSMNMLIAARGKCDANIFHPYQLHALDIVIQGAGSGGMLTLSQINLSDLVTLQERGAYNGLFGL